MFQNLVPTLVMSKPDSLARAFQRFGKWGFFLQVTVVAVILLVAVGAGLRTTSLSPGFAEWMAVAALLVLLGSATLFFRVVKLGSRMADPDTRPPKPSVMRTLQQGLLMNGLGFLLAFSAMLVEVGRLFVITVVRENGAAGQWAEGSQTAPHVISATGVLGLFADQLVMVAALAGAVLTLWLIMRISLVSGYDRKTKRNRS